MNKSRRLLRSGVIGGLLLAAWLVLGVCCAHGQNPGFVLGSSNTVTADPLVARPPETPCVVQLFSGFQFVNFNIQGFEFTPPANCPGPWKKIVFTADFDVTAGRQFDRTVIVDLGYANIYFGTTPEPRSNLSPSWHVERDETDYAALFSGPQTGHVILGNVVNSKYTGVISGSAQLEFYPLPEKQCSDKCERRLRRAVAIHDCGAIGLREGSILWASRRVDRKI